MKLGRTSLIAGVILVASALPAMAGSSIFSDLQDNWGFRSPSQQMVDLNRAHLIELMENGGVTTNYHVTNTNTTNYDVDVDVDVEEVNIEDNATYEDPVSYTTTAGNITNVDVNSEGIGNYTNVDIVQGAQGSTQTSQTTIAGDDAESEIDN